MPERKNSQPERREPPLDKVDEASRESFPASDPPASQPIRPGPPRDKPQPRGKEVRPPD